MLDDLYTANAEWYAALVASWQDELDAGVSALLGPITGDVVDIASGVGTGLPVLRTLGAERLFAVEPSASMRVGLMTTIAADPDLLRRTTVVPAPLPEALEALPTRWGAAVMLNALGHLDDATRVGLWRAAAERLSPGGRLVISLQPPESVTAIPWTDFGAVRIGQQHLTTRGKAETLNDTHVQWTMEWTLHAADGRVVDLRTAEHSWRVLGREYLREEAGEHGLIAIDDGPDSFLAFERP
ncbi:class I SAM-dependent methyltransferase [Enemella sp. A6]|uniref:class I SAM-dependent methyltransferase n=1 Tax=Enemella sp. A6 TaxID=3440152 RepID=UPI003EC07998